MEHLFQVNCSNYSASPSLSRINGSLKRRALQLALGVMLLFVLLLPARTLAASDEPKVKPAKFKISGYGILGNRQLRRILLTTELTKKKPQFFGASFVEDSALILISRVKRDGYLHPELTITLEMDDGNMMQVDGTKLLDNPLPRPLRIVRVQFKIQKGVLYYYNHLEFAGLETIGEKQARAYYIESGALFHPKSSRIYTAERQKNGNTSLSDALDRQGYRDVVVEANELSRNDRTGGVDVRVQVTQGKKYLVDSVREQFFYEKEPEPRESRSVPENTAYSRTWQQDFELMLKTNQFHRGFPDTKVNWETVEQLSNSNSIHLDLLAKVFSGPQVRVGEVEFKGEKKTKLTTMSRRARVQKGELLDPIYVEQGRSRLAQLGTFDIVDLSYRNQDEHTRDVIYQVKEGRSISVNLLFGYGTYELLRGGVEANMYNLWGRAHQLRLKAVQSFKSSSGEFTYTIPQFNGHDFDVFANGTGLRREEISFTRIEYGGGFGVHKYLRDYLTDVSLRYNYQILNAQSVIPAVASEGVTNPAVGAIIADLKYDRRDNPLYPRKGYKVFMNIESATQYLGGDVNYERIQIFPSWHFPVGEGHWINLGLTHAVDISFGSPANNLPFNRRFFPGGANSIRGYNEDEASPRNAEGKIVGAETYTLLSVEFEQALTAKWNVVFFSDNLGFAHSINDYPFDTGLFSVGGGIRWKSLIGPVRLEYGYNLNPRPKDPLGTLQFSIGFPF
jgi:outer membrane protein insertion porin family